MEMKHKNPPVNFCPRMPNMYGIDSNSARLKCRLTEKKLVCTHFYGTPDFGGLAAVPYLMLSQNTYFYRIRDGGGVGAPPPPPAFI